MKTPLVTEASYWETVSSLTHVIRAMINAFRIKLTAMMTKATAWPKIFPQII